jgi:hypothetical protein
VSSLPVSYEPSCVSINSELPDVAVGGALDNKVIAVILHLYLTNTATCHLTV